MKPTSLASALIAELDDEALDELARRLAPRLAGLAPAPVEERYLDVDGAAAYVGCGKRRIYDLTTQGRLRVHKFGSLNRYLREDLDAFVAGGVDDLKEAA
jgi:excisionase family DNA binding protein